MVERPNHSAHGDAVQAQLLGSKRVALFGCFLALFATTVFFPENDGGDPPLK